MPSDLQFSLAGEKGKLLPQTGGVCKPKRKLPSGANLPTSTASLVAAATCLIGTFATAIAQVAHAAMLPNFRIRL